MPSRSSKLLLAVSIFLTISTNAMGQGDFELPPLQYEDFVSELSSVDAVTPIATSYVEDDESAAQATFATEDWVAPPEQELDFLKLTRHRKTSDYFDRPRHSWTVSAFGGPSYIRKQSEENSRAILDGSLLGLSIGKRLGSYLRTELELSSRNFDVEKSYFPGFFGSSGISRGSEITNYSGMVNVYADYDRGPETRLTPYIGIGLGFSKAQVEDTVNSRRVATGDGTAFASQVMVGLAIRITDRSRFYTEFRGFSTQEHEIDMYLSSSSNRRVGQYKYKAASNDLVFGLRFDF